jgi:hypothetical protein
MLVFSNKSFAEGELDQLFFGDASSVLYGRVLDKGF